MDKFTVAMELINALEEKNLSEYEECKFMLLSMVKGRNHITHFLKVCFELVEKKHPRLLEIKQ